MGVGAFFLVILVFRSELKDVAEENRRPSLGFVATLGTIDVELFVEDFLDLECKGLEEH
jgi:hypothetical protein